MDFVFYSFSKRKLMSTGAGQHKFLSSWQNQSYDICTHFDAIFLDFLKKAVKDGLFHNHSHKQGTWGKLKPAKIFLWKLYEVMISPLTTVKYNFFEVRNSSK